MNLLLLKYVSINMFEHISLYIGINISIGLNFRNKIIESNKNAHYRLNCVLPEIHVEILTHYLRMWPYSEMESLQR